MSEATKRLDTADTSALLDRLNDIRLTRDWSYRQLADDIERVTGLAISSQTIQPLLSGRSGEQKRPYDRTLYKIQRYLNALPADQSTKQPRKAKGRAA